ncbi:MAG: PIN domain-containing protein [Hyphomicrobiales bacterium]
MIGLDTNVVVRYLAQDDASQSAAASRLMEALSPEVPGLLTSVALAEVAWVMEELYGASRAQVGTIVKSLLQTRALVVQDAEVVWRALSRYRGGSADFADYLIERSCVALGCEATYTFDEKAARNADCGMTPVV